MSYYTEQKETIQPRRQTNRRTFEQTFKEKKRLLYLLDNTPMIAEECGKTMEPVVDRQTIQYWIRNDEIFRKEYEIVSRRNHKRLPNMEVFEHPEAAHANGYAQAKLPPPQSNPAYYQPATNQAVQESKVDAAVALSSVFAKLTKIEKMVTEMTNYLEESEIKVKRKSQKQKAYETGERKKSQFKNVFFYKGEWFASVQKTSTWGTGFIRLGGYQSEEEAVLARDTYFKQKGMPVPDDGSKNIDLSRVAS